MVVVAPGPSSVPAPPLVPPLYQVPGDQLPLPHSIGTTLPNASSGIYGANPVPANGAPITSISGIPINQYKSLLSHGINNPSASIQGQDSVGAFFSDITQTDYLLIGGAAILIIILMSS